MLNVKNGVKPQSINIPQRLSDARTNCTVDSETDSDTSDCNSDSNSDPDEYDTENRIMLTVLVNLIFSQKCVDLSTCLTIAPSLMLGG